MRHYKKGEYRDQFVIAYIADLSDYEDVVKWSIRFSNLLQKGLILLHISDPVYTDISTTEAEKKLKEINDQISLPYTHTYAAVKGKTKDVIHNTGDLLNGVMIVSKVLNKNHSSINTLSKTKNPLTINNILSNFYTSRLAYFIFADKYKDTDFKEVVLSMNGLKEAKEKILWASYFGRFAKSRINIFYHRYRDEFLQKQLNLNIGFSRRMFRNFDIETLNVHCMKKNALVDVQAMEYAENESRSICIFQTTSNKSFIDFFQGLSERKVLQTMKHVPVLFLNHRDDIFVMCE